MIADRSHAERLEQLSSAHGFSLVELMVAVFLILITVPVFAGMQLSAVKANNHAAELDQSIWGAQAKMEELWLVDVDDLAKGDDEMPLAGGRVLTRSWTVANNKPMKGLKTVTVTVTTAWIEGSESAELQFVVGSRLKSFGYADCDAESGKSGSGGSGSGESGSGGSGSGESGSGGSGSGKSGSGGSGSGESGSGGSKSGETKC